MRLSCRYLVPVWLDSRRGSTGDSCLKDCLQDAGYYEQSDDEDDADHPQQDFHTYTPPGFVRTHDSRSGSDGPRPTKWADNSWHLAAGTRVRRLCLDRFSSNVCFPAIPDISRLCLLSTHCGHSPLDTALLMVQPSARSRDGVRQREAQRPQPVARDRS